jgi:integrase
MMSLFQYKGSKVWTMDFQVGGQRVRETTGTPNRRLAERIEQKRKQDIEAGRAGITKPQGPLSFADRAAEIVSIKKAGIDPKEVRGAARTLEIIIRELSHLTPFFGKQLLCNITPADWAAYVKLRFLEGASPATINNERGSFRTVLTASGDWQRLIKKCPKIPNTKEVGRALTEAQMDALFEACWMSESRILPVAINLQFETGSRPGTVKAITWDEVDFVAEGLRWGRDKSKAGSGRFVPLSKRMMEILRFWADQFPDRKPIHFVFPSERYRQPKTSERGKLNPYTTDPTKPVVSLQRSWETALERAGWILAGRPKDAKSAPPLVCRFHDLRHTAITRMVKRRVPIPVIAKLVGWSPTTMWEMAKKYSHFYSDDLRDAT